MQKPQYYHLESSALNYLTVKEKQLSLKMKSSGNKTVKTLDPRAHVTYSLTLQLQGMLHRSTQSEGYVLNSLTLLQGFTTE